MSANVITNYSKAFASLLRIGVTGALWIFRVHCSVFILLTRSGVLRATDTQFNGSEITYFMINVFVIGYHYQIVLFISLVDVDIGMKFSEIL